MAITYTVGAAAASADTNTVTTAAVSSLGSNFVVVSCSDYTGAAVALTVTDNQGNGNYTPLTAYSNGTTLVREQLFYKTNPTVGASHTVTATGTGGFPAMSVLFFAGANASSPFDVENGSAGTSGTTIQPGTVTPALDNEVVITGLEFVITAATVSIDLSFQQPLTRVDYVAGVNFGNAIAYLIQTTATAVNPTWTLSGVSHDLMASIASFKADTGTKLILIPGR